MHTKAQQKASITIQRAWRKFAFWLPDSTLPVLMTIWLKEDTEMEYGKGKRFASIYDAMVRLWELRADDIVFTALIEHDAFGSVYSLRGNKSFTQF